MPIDYKIRKAVPKNIEKVSSGSGYFVDQTESTVRIRSVVIRSSGRDPEQSVKGWSSLNKKLSGSRVPSTRTGSNK